MIQFFELIFRSVAKPTPKIDLQPRAECKSCQLEVVSESSPDAFAAGWSGWCRQAELARNEGDDK
jgi:hypothetical protein